MVDLRKCVNEISEFSNFINHSKSKKVKNKYRKKSEQDFFAFLKKKEEKVKSARDFWRNPYFQKK
jgi:hypothetical protein